MDLSNLFANRDLPEEKFQKGKKVESGEVLPPEKHYLFTKLEKRKGKSVTVVGEFQIRNSKELLKSLKKSLSVGGTVKENFLEFQGDCREKVRIELEKIGFKFR
jgi:translation initiation factor 1